jgi:Glycosyltransferase family 87
MWIRLVVVTILAGLLFQAKPDLFPPRDFLEYYSAAKVFASGGDPYDGAQLLPVQRHILGNPDLNQSVSLWTPPYTLALYLPFGLLPYSTAHLVWLLMQTLLMALSVELIVRSFTWRQVSNLSTSWKLVATFAFSPFFWNLHFGQNTGYILLGLAGFVRFRPTRPMLAGSFAALTAIKPHLLAVFGVLLIWDAWNRDGRRTLLGGLLLLLVGSVVVWAKQPHIFEWFLEALQRPTTPDAVRLADWDVPLLSYEFRRAINPDRFGLQFIPLAVTCIGVIVWYWKRPIHWPSTLPWIVLLSCLVAPYGGWIFDLTVLVLPILALLSGPRDPRMALLALALISWFGFRIVGLAEPIWFTPAIAVVLGYQWFQSRSQTS